VCPAWAPVAALSIETLPPLPEFNTTKDLDVVTDLNAVPDAGLTVRGRQDALEAAVIAAVAKATNNATQIEGGLNVATPPGIFEPLNEQEILAGGTGWAADRGIACIVCAAEVLLCVL
jgi:hypothetical protein